MKLTQHFKVYVLTVAVLFTPLLRRYTLTVNVGGSEFPATALDNK